MAGQWLLLMTLPLGNPPSETPALYIRPDAGTHQSSRKSYILRRRVEGNPPKAHQSLHMPASSSKYCFAGLYSQTGKVELQPWLQGSRQRIPWASAEHSVCGLSSTGGCGAAYTNGFHHLHLADLPDVHMWQCLQAGCKEWLAARNAQLAARNTHQMLGKASPLQQNTKP